MRFATALGLTAGSFLTSMPAPGRNGETGGTRPTNPGIIGMPFGIGIGMDIDDMSIESILAFAGAFALARPFDESGVIPGMPGIEPGVFGGLVGLVCAPALAANAKPQTAAMSKLEMRLTEGSRETKGDSGKSATTRSATFHAALSDPRELPDPYSPQP